MSKPIKLSTKAWKNIRSAIKADHPPSVWMIRGKMKQVLGFTPRFHYAPIMDQKATAIDRYLNAHTVYLDFASEPLRTMFILKYMHLSD